jgi:hypothetical protein
LSLPCPTPAQLERALAAARTLREAGADGEHLGWVVECLHQRCADLEALLVLVDRYLRFGMPEHELAQMRRLADRLREHAAGGAREERHEGDLPL